MAHSRRPAVFGVVLMTLLSTTSLIATAARPAGQRLAEPAPVGRESLLLAPALQQPGAVAEPVPEVRQEEKPAEPAGPPPVELSLHDAIAMAVERNLDLQVRRLDPQQRRQDEIGARGLFDPTLFADFNHEKQNRKPTNALATTSTRLDTYSVGVDKQFLSGGRATLSLDSSRLDQTSVFAQFFNPTYNSGLSLSFTQPLLRGFGATVNRRNIVFARNSIDISENDVKATMLDRVKEVTDAYWDLAAAISNLGVGTQSLDLARNLLKLNKAKVDVGTLAPIEITQAEAGVASREEAVIVAENAILAAEDNLRRLLNAPKDSDLWGRPIRPQDEPPFEILQPNMEGEIQTAMSKRPELEQQRIGLKNLELQVEVDHNGKLPALDLRGAYGLSGTAGRQRATLLDLDADGVPDCNTSDPNCVCPASNPGCVPTPVDRNGDGTDDFLFIAQDIGDAWQQVLDRDLVSYSVGLNFRFPIGNRAAKAAYARSVIALDQGRLSLQNLERSVEFEVRDAVRQVQTNIKRVQAARVNLGLQKEKLEAEQKRFQYGMTDSFKVLEFQNDLTEAESAEIRAIIDYNKSLATLSGATGTLLEQHGIEVR